MEPRMKTSAENDAGAAQFVTRYGEAAASPVVQQAYKDWIIADFRDRSLRKGAWLEGFDEGVDKGVDKGVAKAKTAMKMLENGRSIEMIMEDTGLTKEQIDSLR